MHLQSTPHLVKIESAFALKNLLSRVAERQLASIQPLSNKLPIALKCLASTVRWRGADNLIGYPTTDDLSPFRHVAWHGPKDGEMWHVGWKLDLPRLSLSAFFVNLSCLASGRGCCTWQDDNCLLSEMHMRLTFPRMIQVPVAEEILLCRELRSKWCQHSRAFGRLPTELTGEVKFRNFRAF